RARGFRRGGVGLPRRGRGPRRRCGRHPAPPRGGHRLLRAGRDPGAEGRGRRPTLRRSPRSRLDSRILRAQAHSRPGSELRLSRRLHPLSDEHSSAVRRDRTKGRQMKVHLGTDHAGFEFKEVLRTHLEKAGHEVVDHGALEYDALDDYPAFCIAAAPAARRSASSSAGRATVSRWRRTWSRALAPRWPGTRRSRSWHVRTTMLRSSRSVPDSILRTKRSPSSRRSWPNRSRETTATH